jgi:hypothetical protein
VSEQQIPDDTIHDMAETVLRSVIGDASYQDIGELMASDPRFNELPQEQFDAAQTRVSDILGEAIVTITWPESGATS